MKPRFFFFSPPLGARLGPRHHRPRPNRPAAGPPAAPVAAAPATSRVARARTDAHGNAIRVATRTGHVSNYDEAKVGAYTLPDPLILANGQPVKDADHLVQMSAAPS